MSQDSIPEDWYEAPLDQLLVTLESGSRPKGGVRGIECGIPSLGGEHLSSDGGFDFSSVKYVPHKFFEGMRRGHIQQGDVLVVKDGATTGKVSVVDLDFPYRTAVVNEHVFICRPDESIDSKYLFYFLFSEDGQQRILENFRGSAQGGINKQFAPNTLIPVAPLPEQKRIVAKLDEIMSEIKAAKEHLARAKELIRKFRQSVLNAAVTGKLTEGWRRENTNVIPAVETVREIHENRDSHVSDLNIRDIRRGRRIERSSWREAPSYIPLDEDTLHSWCETRIGDISECLDRLRIPVSKDARNKRKGTVPYFGANGQVGWIDDWIFDEELVLVVEDETFVGRTKPFSYIISGKTWVNNHAHVLAPLGNISADYLNICLSFYDFIPLTSGSTGRRKLNQADLMPAPLRIAPIAEQEEIVKRVGQYFNQIDRVIELISLTETKGESLSQSALCSAFNGELLSSEGI